MAIAKSLFQQQFNSLFRRERIVPAGGFTLAELLIALTILGVIATFTIPKIITAQQNSSYNASAKEVAATVAAAYQSYVFRNGSSSGAGIANITQYMNYIAVDSTSTIDSFYGDSSATTTCGAFSGVCLKMHNGAYLQYWPSDNFSGTASTNGVPFLIDPNGTSTAGTTNGSGKALYFFLYYNGSVKDLGNITPNTSWSAQSGWNPNSGQVPPWFSW